MRIEHISTLALATRALAMPALATFLGCSHSKQYADHAAVHDAPPRAGAATLVAAGPCPPLVVEAHHAGFFIELPACPYARLSIPRQFVVPLIAPAAMHRSTQGVAP